MEKINKVQVTIAGQQYTLRSEDPVEHMQKVAREVEEKFNFVRRLFPEYSLNKQAMLTAFQLADEKIKVEEEYNQFLEEADLTDEK